MARLREKVETLGVISDTHGLVRPEALSAFAGVDLIIHAGDIGAPGVVAALRSIARVVAIRGNNDRAEWARKYPESSVVDLGALKIFVIHDVKDLAVDPSQAGYGVVVSGHSHSPSVAARDGVLFLNPGSAGPRRFKLPVAVAKLRMDGSFPRAEIVELHIPTAGKRIP